MTNWFIWELSKPVVAQLHGYCLAGGTELASVCDFRIVEEKMQVGYPPVRAMTTMDMMWTPWFLPPAKAREFAYVGDSFSGQQMADLGWANYALPLEELDDFTREFAERMTHIDNDMLMYSKRAVNRQYEIMGIRTGLASGYDVQASAPTGRRAVSSGGAAARMASRPPSSGGTARSATSAGRTTRPRSGATCRASPAPRSARTATTRDRRGSADPGALVGG